MTSDGEKSLDGLPLRDRRAINEICLEFERAWNDGRHPRIEEYAGRMTGRAGKALLVELIAQDIDLRIADEQIVGHQQYYDRFPHAAQEVDAALALISSRGDSDRLDDPTVARNDMGPEASPPLSLAVVEPGSARHRRFAEIVAGLMKNIQEGGQYELEQLAREYPEHAEELRLLHPGMQLLSRSLQRIVRSRVWCRGERGVGRLSSGPRDRPRWHGHCV